MRVGSPVRAQECQKVFLGHANAYRIEAATTTRHTTVLYKPHVHYFQAYCAIMHDARGGDGKLRPV